MMNQKKSEVVFQKTFCSPVVSAVDEESNLFRERTDIICIATQTCASMSGVFFTTIFFKKL